MTRFKTLMLAAALLPLVLAGTTDIAGAARGQGDWPCVQREVPEISAGVVWSGGAIDPEDRSWSTDEKIAPKVAEVSSRRKTVEEAIAAIDQFAASLTEDRNRLLTGLFIGVLQNVNAERSKVMGGIKRYARKQAALANRIKERSIQRAELSRKDVPSEDEKRKLAELDEQITWDTRIYDDREQSLRYVCETPVLMEQRLFQIGRHISQLVSQN
ncbi:MAG TPA: hypothetical protein VH858_01545 [Hyphomicrobiales bacterium]|jgi:hypothetical protein